MKAIGDALAQWKDSLSALQSLTTIAAILIGAVWAYFKIAKGRLYTTRLEPSVDGIVVSADDYQVLMVKITVKNVGISRVNLDKEKTTLEVSTYDKDDYIDLFHNARLQEAGVVNAIHNHDWIEPGECIYEQRLLALPVKNVISIVIKLRILNLKPRWSLIGGGVVWNAIAIIPADRTLSSPEIAKGRSNRI